MYIEREIERYMYLSFSLSLSIYIYIYTSAVTRLSLVVLRVGQDVLFRYHIKYIMNYYYTGYSLFYK